MTTGLKEYKELTTIQLFEGEILTTMKIEEIYDYLNNDKKFMYVGNEIIAKNQIKKVFVRQVDSIDNFILSQPKDIQDKLRAREKDKYAKVGRKFDSVQEVQNFITNNL